MSFIQGENRYQISVLPNILDDYVSEDNPVRVIDAYVDSLDLDIIGFKIFKDTQAGQKPYRRKDLLKISLYCYTNNIRSSRKMELETMRNIELMWLVGKLSPDHGTLSSFVKDNKSAIKQLFKEFSLMLKGFGLVDGELVAIDGTKIKASSAKNKHFNENVINIKTEYYESKIEEYLNSLLETTDEEKQRITEKVESYKERIENLSNLKKEIEQEKKKQICLTDSDSRSMKNNGKFEVCYNLQTAVDSKYKFILAYDVVNDINDQGQLVNMISKAREILSIDKKCTFVADTGYYNKAKIVASINENTEILIKKQKGKKEKLASGFDREYFKYDTSKDIYICPRGYTLEFKWKDSKNGQRAKRYVCINYMDCGKKDLCTAAKKGRVVTRSMDEDIIENILKNTIDKNDIYRKRGSIVEHPFGTIKRHYGYSYFSRRGLESVNAEGGFICLAYNFKRLVKVIDVRKLVAHFKSINSSKTRFLKYVAQIDIITPIINGIAVFQINC